MSANSLPKIYLESIFMNLLDFLPKLLDRQRHLISKYRARTYIYCFQPWTLKKIKRTMNIFYSYKNSQSTFSGWKRQSNRDFARLCQVRIHKCDHWLDFISQCFQASLNMGVKTWDIVGRDECANSLHFQWKIKCIFSIFLLEPL